MNPVNSAIAPNANGGDAKLRLDPPARKGLGRFGVMIKGEVEASRIVPRIPVGTIWRRYKCPLRIAGQSPYSENGNPMLERKPIFPNVIEMNHQVRRVLGCNVYLVHDQDEWVLVDIGYEAGSENPKS